MILTRPEPVFPNTMTVPSSGLPFSATVDPSTVRQGHEPLEVSGQGA